jgi:hypothetical protein
MVGVVVGGRLARACAAVTMSDPTNLHRRHLNESQRSMVAAKLAKLPKGTNQHAQICAPSQERAGELLNVSRRAVQRAAAVQEHGVPELARRVERGEVAVSVAAKVAAMPKDRQESAAARWARSYRARQRLGLRCFVVEADHFAVVNALIAAGLIGDADLSDAAIARAIGDVVRIFIEKYRHA